MKTWVAGGALQAAALAAVAAGGAAEARPCVRHLAHYAWRAPWSGLQRGASCRYALSGFALDAATWPAGLRAWPHADHTQAMPRKPTQNTTPTFVCGLVAHADVGVAFCAGFPGSAFTGKRFVMSWPDFRVTGEGLALFYERFLSMKDRSWGKVLGSIGVARGGDAPSFCDPPSGSCTAPRVEPKGGMGAPPFKCRKRPVLHPVEYHKGSLLLPF